MRSATWKRWNKASVFGGNSMAGFKEFADLKSLRDKLKEEERLRLSLHRGPRQIMGAYESNSGKFGDRFRRGDGKRIKCLALESLPDPLNEAFPVNEHLRTH